VSTAIKVNRFGRLDFALFREPPWPAQVK